MSAEINDNMSFEEMLNASEEKRVHAGSIVKGIVTSISANEIQVDIGAKQTGFVKLSELTDDSSAKVEDLVKVGDELDLIVEKVMDQDGVIQLSRKKLASRKGMEEIAKAAESGEVVEGDVTEFNKGGVVVNVKGVKVFVPRSQATMRRDEDYTALVGQHVQLVVTECSGRKIVGSINKVTAEQNKAKREEFWANVEVGKSYTGVVKSLTSYGAFVDIGGVDGLCHISELSWNRINHPSEVVNYSENYSLHSSGVVFDILFRGVPIVGSRCGTLQMVEANELGKTVSSMADFAPERLLDEAVHDRYVRNIARYCQSQAQERETLRDFLTRGAVE